ncbi:MAG: UDP-N-acetylmuramate dehydrogenase, partial [Candidatus Parcubacteria bacterium]
MTNLKQFADKLQEQISAKVLVNEPLHKYSSIKLGGPADLFVNATVLEDIATCITFCRENNLDYFMLGGGTNTLISDSGFRGLVIRNNV